MKLNHVKNASSGITLTKHLSKGFINALISNLNAFVSSIPIIELNELVMKISGIKKINLTERKDLIIKKQVLEKISNRAERNHKLYQESLNNIIKIIDQKCEELELTDEEVLKIRTENRKKWKAEDCDLYFDFYEIIAEHNHSLTGNSETSDKPQLKEIKFKEKNLLQTNDHKDLLGGFSEKRPMTAFQK